MNFANSIPQKIYLQAKWAAHSKSEEEFEQKFRMGMVPTTFVGVLMGVMYFLHPPPVISLVWPMLLAVLMATSGLVRWPLGRKAQSQNLRIRRFWQKYMDISLFFQSCSWALISIFNIYFYSILGSPNILNLIVLVGFGAGSLGTYSRASVKGHLHYIITIFLPGIFCFFEQSRDGYLIGSFLILFTAFLNYQIKIIYGDFINHFIQNELVKSETKELEQSLNVLNEEIELRKFVELNLKIAKIEALEYSRQRSEFMANIAHEINTPLNGIIGLSNLFFEKCEDESQKKIANMIRTCSEDLLHIVSHVLGQSRGQASVLSTEIRNFNLRELMIEVHQLLEAKAKIKGLHFEVSFKCDREFVQGDSIKIKQILNNLVSNAIKFTEKGSVLLEVVSYDSNGQRKYIFRVKDSGIGISNEAQRKLFHNFIQADKSTSRKYGGSGLGLSICRQLADLMGGYISLESQVGRGTTLEFGLNLEDGFTIESQFKLEGSSEKKVLNEPMLSSELFSEGKVLVAEDNLVNQQVILKMLEKYGIFADLAKDGWETIERAKAGDYDLILMDIQMPGLSGIQATEEIRSWGNKIKQPMIVAVTASVLDSEFEKVQRAGVDQLITKPVKFIEIQRILNRIQYRDSDFIKKFPVAS